MIKAHSPINWENEPSFNTPINETNLNKMDSTIGILDDRIIEQETSKLDKATAYTMVKDISFNENNGVFTVTRLNGSTFTIDTKLEKISINFDYNAETQQIEIILIDGTKQYIDISSLISPIDFVDSDTIGWEVTSDWKVKSKVLDGSITEDMLQPNYLAEIKVETEKSAQSMANAKISENNAKQSELNAKASEEQALEYSNNAQPLAQSVSGNNPTATNSADASLIYLNNKGYTQQEKLAFDGKVTTTTNGIKNTNPIPCNNGDSITVTVSTGLGAIRVYNANNEPLLAFPQESVPQPKTKTFTLNVDVTGIFIEIETTATTMEIKVNGSAYATPSPDNPIHIGASADKGYFDGELYSGYYSGETGVKAASSNGTTICSNNYMEVSENDVVELSCEEIATQLWISFYDADKNYISRVVTTSALYGNTKVLSGTAPTNAKYFTFTISNSNGISVSTARHICVTINGQYALRVKTTNSNIMPISSVGTTFELTDNNTIKTLISNVGHADNGHKVCEFYLIAGKTYKISLCMLSKPTSSTSFTPYIDGVVNSEGWLPNVNTYNLNAIKTKTYTPTKDCTLRYTAWGNANDDTFEFQFWCNEDEVRDYEHHTEIVANIPVSAPLYDGDYIEVYADGTGREYRENYSSLLPKSGWTVTDETNSKQATIYSTNTSAVFGELRQELTSTHFGNTDTNKIVYYRGSFWVKFPSEYTNEEITNVFANNDIVFVGKRATPTSTPLTQEQVAEFRKLQTFNGVTHVTADGDVVMRYYCDNASGETVEMLHNMTTNIFMTSSHTYESTESEEVNVGQKLEIDIPIDSIDGYTPLAVIGFNVNDIGVGSVRFNDSKTSVLIDGKVLTKINQSTGELQSTISTKTKATATVLWVKNILIKNGMP